jgi:hypothetical protein
MNDAAEALIEDARKSLDDPSIATVLDACEAFYLNGCADEMAGDVDAGGHYYRVDRWIVRTDSQGFHYLDPYPTVEQAERAFSILSSDFDREESE